MQQDASEQREKQRVVIIGGGIAGVASAWALSRNPRYECLVLERESQLAAHSTSLNASILRSLTGSWATTELALETAEFLRRPPAGFTSQPLLDAVGLILIHAQPDQPLCARWLKHKTPGWVTQLSQQELRRALPAWEGQRTGAMLVRDEGHIDTSALFAALLRDAQRHGARFVCEAEVAHMLSDGERLEGVVLQSGEVHEADRVLIAGGGWAQKLGRMAGSDLPLEARRRHLLVTAPEPSIDPRWPILWSEPDNFYLRPESGGLMLCACDTDPVDPDRCELRPEVRELIAERSARFLPGLSDLRSAHFWSGLRTFAPDPEFVIGFDGKLQNLFWVAGLGGHGMSTCIGVGRLVERLMSAGRGLHAPAQACDPRRLPTLVGQ